LNYCRILTPVPRRRIIHHPERRASKIFSKNNC